MSIIANIPVMVTPEADAYINDIGKRKTFERMLEHLPEHFAGMQSISVTLALDGEEGCRPTVLFDVNRENPGDYDGEDRRWDRWVIENFPPEEFQHFVVVSHRI